MAITDRSIIQLIGSMGRTEKAHFKKFGFKRQTDGQQNMLDMFDAVDKMLSKNVDQKQMERQMEAAWQKAGISNSALVRNRLFNALLDSLRDHQRQKSVEEELMRAYRTSDILINRKLLAEADSMLTKALKKAEQLQMNEFIMLLERQRHYILHANNQRKGILENLVHREHVALEIAHHVQLGKRYEQTYQLQIKSGQEGNDTKISELKVIEAEVDKVELRPDDTKGLILKYSILHTINFDLQNTQKAQEISAYILKVFEADQAYLERNYKAYMLLIYNHLNDCVNCNDTKAFNKRYPDLIALAEKPELKEQIENYSVSILLDLALMSEAPNDMVTFKTEFEKWRPNGLDRLHINNKLDMLFRASILFYLHNYTDTALDIVQEFLKQGKRGLRDDLELKVAVLQIMVHLQNDQDELAQYQLRSLNNRAKQQDFFNEAQNGFIKLLGKMLAPARKESIKDLAKAYLKKQTEIPFAELKTTHFLKRIAERKAY